ncbi:hypothetical protein TTHERM_000156699 (macronuclear) [Tetrahymena thermophila SB210]|uniref:Uncharacterized protein n=1 Tax=Tetrahymena thermophila (strain SB210) TaxID=312017 RepID=W7XGB6_TETTS|nr:hypothetical protein TTHERM_000156699 [Tetrahymena thermophila SB210]EWS75988.1 hypothetical protein TTHERM_000156699 [Tetrahymena thermophila SB210]|eukprot:XP_012651506.1 hypothetical protein TTHERM_000156699 [Tetrahymena thermophila SB210]
MPIMQNYALLYWTSHPTQSLRKLCTECFDDKCTNMHGYNNKARLLLESSSLQYNMQNLIKQNKIFQIKIKTTNKKMNLKFIKKQEMRNNFFNQKLTQRFDEEINFYQFNEKIFQNCLLINNLLSKHLKKILKIYKNKKNYKKIKIYLKHHKKIKKPLKNEQKNQKI